MAAEGAPGSSGDSTFTFLFTDIEGSTILWERYPEGMRVALETHDALLRSVAARHGGDVFKTIGDAFCVAFPNAPDALRAALAGQRELRDAFADAPFPLRVRMALHTGDAQRRDADYFGGGLSKVARLLSAIHGGQVALTRVTAELVRGRLPADTTLRDMGEHLFRGFERADHVYQVDAPNLPTDFPPLRTADTIRHNLPRQLTPFIGRDKEAGEVRRLIGLSPLVTLTGTGGTGKTRLALHVAESLLADFPDGVWFVDLAPLTDGSLAARAVAAAIGLRPDPGGEDDAAVENHLRAKRALLILDNCEHVILPVATLAENLLMAAPGLRILATSREALDIGGEALFRVPPLSIPRGEVSPRRLMQSEAARLFVERAQQAVAAFKVTAENVAPIAAICRRLDGIPLALLVAASWVSALTPGQIEQRLSERLLRSQTSRTAHARQQTLRATLDWSNALLSESERALFRRVAVFAGGWTLDAAEAVCASVGTEGSADAPVTDVLDGLFALVHKSLVVTLETPEGTRYRLLEPVRQYARDMLEASGEVPAVSERHSRYFAQLAEEAAPLITAPDNRAVMDRLETETDNLRAALAHMETADTATGLRTVAALSWFWYVRGHIAEGRRWLDMFLAAAGPDADTATRAKAENGSGILAWRAGDLAVARAHFETSLALREAAGDAGEAAKCRNNLGMVASSQEKWEDAEAYFERSLAYYRAAGHQRLVVMVLSNLGNLANIIHDQDDSRTDKVEAAYGYLSEALPLQRAEGPSIPYANTVHNFSIISRKRGDLREALDLFQEGFMLQRSFAHQPGIIEMLESAPLLAEAAGKPLAAAELFGAAVEYRDQAGIPRKAEFNAVKTCREAVRQKLGDAVWGQQVQQGRLLNLDDVAERIARLAEEC